MTFMHAHCVTQGFRQPAARPEKKSVFLGFFEKFLGFLNIWATKVAQYLIIGLTKYFGAANEAKIKIMNCERSAPQFYTPSCPNSA